MLKHRVIPSLLMMDGGLVKTHRFKRPQYVGDPINAIRIFNEKEVDELLLLDISATKEHRQPDWELLDQIAGECFMPLCYGGGVKTIEEAKTIFALGVEKVCLQTGAFSDYSFISRLSERYGSQSIVVSIDIKRDWLGRYKLFDYTRGKTVSRSWKEVLKSVVKFGAGEVIINLVNNEGTMAGVDIGLIRECCTGTAIPVIATGGVGSLEDIKLAIQAGASAVAAGAYFVFQGPHRAVLITYPQYSDLVKLLETQ